MGEVARVFLNYGVVWDDTDECIRTFVDKLHDPIIDGSFGEPSKKKAGVVMIRYFSGIDRKDVARKTYSALNMNLRTIIDADDGSMYSVLFKTHICARPGCSKDGEKMCSQCRITRYCGTDCQRSDWKRHKKECKSEDVGICIDSTLLYANNLETSLKTPFRDWRDRLLMVCRVLDLFALTTDEDDDCYVVFSSPFTQSQRDQVKRFFGRRVRPFNPGKGLVWMPRNEILRLLPLVRDGQGMEVHFLPGWTREMQYDESMIGVRSRLVKATNPDIVVDNIQDLMHLLDG